MLDAARRLRATGADKSELASLLPTSKSTMRLRQTTARQRASATADAGPRVLTRAAAKRRRSERIGTVSADADAAAAALPAHKASKASFFDVFNVTIGGLQFPKKRVRRIQRAFFSYE